MTRQETATKLRDMATGIEERAEGPGVRIYRLSTEAVTVLREAADELDHACHEIIPMCANPVGDHGDLFCGPDDHQPDATTPAQRARANEADMVRVMGPEATTPDRVCGFECECSPGCKARCDRPPLHGGEHRKNGLRLWEQTQLDLTDTPE